MSTFDELDELLSGDYTDNYWENDVALTARDLVGQLTDADWQTLESGWKGHEADWRRRLADVLSRGDPRRTVPILVPMIEADDDELALTAADSLNAVATAVRYSVLTAKAQARLGALSRKSKLNARVIDNLLTRMNRDQPTG